MNNINLGIFSTVSRVFDDDDDENEGEHIESIKLIEDISKQLADKDNGDCKQNIELEKERIYGELNAMFEEKLNAVKTEAQRNSEEAEEKLKAAVANARRNHEDYLERLQKAEDDLEIQRREAKIEREDVVAEMIGAHEAEIKRIKDDAEAKLNEPRLKRKQSLTSAEQNTFVLNGDLVSIAVPVVDTSVYTILETGELEFVEFLPYNDEEPKNDKGNARYFRTINYD